MKVLILSFLVCCLPAILPAQSSLPVTDSSRLQISLLTCAPGQELYATFGHSALRIIDSNSVTDLVYNYGTFDFNDPQFYTKFVKGQLNYYLSVELFSQFKFDYQVENRAITEQVLNLTAAQKLQIRAALKENLKEENRFYLYDFFLDNCTTRLRDLIFTAAHPKETAIAVMPTTYTFRNAIHFYLNQNEKYWSKLGIDLLLGKPTDAVMTREQQQFLPDNLMKALAQINTPALVKSTTNLYIVNSANKTKQWFTPFSCFWGLLIFISCLSMFKQPYLKKILAGFDVALFFSYGLLGLLFLVMWFGTNHSMTKVNYNLLWAIPTHVVMAFFINSRKRFVKKYFLFTSLLSLFTLITWFFLPQQLNIALIPLVILIGFRAYCLFIKK